MSIILLLLDFLFKGLSRLQFIGSVKASQQAISKVHVEADDYTLTLSGAHSILLIAN